MRALLLALTIGLLALLRPDPILAVDEPITIVHGSDADAPPWRLLLADGTLCEGIWGGTAAAGAAIGRYGCTGSGYLSDRLYQGRTWVAVRLNLELGPHGFSLRDIEPVAVSEVWYCNVTSITSAESPSCP